MKLRPLFWKNGRFANDGMTEEQILNLYTVPEPNSGCLLWLGALTEGYGYTRQKTGYRWAYETFVGPIPPKHDLHHRCEVRLCVNVKHLEPLSRRDHLLTRTPRTMCWRGHPWTPASTIQTIIRGQLERQCRVCNNEKQRKYYHRRMARERSAP